MTADELARVTAERDAACDEVTRLDAELAGVRASLVEQAEDAEDARGTLAMRDGQLREAVAALGRVEAFCRNLEQYERDGWWLQRYYGPNCETCKTPMSAEGMNVGLMARDALTGPQDASGGKVASGATGDAQGPQISARDLAEAVGRPTWAGLYGADPDYTDGKDVGEWLDEGRGQA